MRKCVVCNTSYTKGSDKSFHSFPKNEVKKKLWLKACKMTLYLPSYKICGDHFLPEHYLPSGYLKNDAVPFLAPISRDIEPSDHHSTFTSSPSPKKCLVIEPIATSTTNIKPSDHLYASTLIQSPKRCTIIEPIATSNTEIKPSDHLYASTLIKSPKRCTIREPIATSNTDIKPSDHLYASTISKSSKKRKDKLNANTIEFLSPSHFSSPRKTMQHLAMVKYKFKQKQIQNANLKKQIKRFKKKLTSYDDLILKLQQKLFLIESASVRLQVKFSL